MVRYNRQHWTDKRKEYSRRWHAMLNPRQFAKPLRWVCLGPMPSAGSKELHCQHGPTNLQMPTINHIGQLVVQIGGQSPRSSATVAQSLPLDDDGAGVGRLRVDPLPIIEGRPGDSDPRHRCHGANNQPITTGMRSDEACKRRSRLEHGHGRRFSSLRRRVCVCVCVCVCSAHINPTRGPLGMDYTILN